MSEYKDRGIIKWAPFDALTGHSSTIEELIYTINKRQKNVLSDDQYEEMNETISVATKESKDVSIDYFIDGYQYTTYGKIIKIDNQNKILELSTNEKIEFDSIVEIRIER